MVHSFCFEMGDRSIWGCPENPCQLLEQSRACAAADVKVHRVKVKVGAAFWSPRFGPLTAEFQLRNSNVNT